MLHAPRPGGHMATKNWIWAGIPVFLLIIVLTVGPWRFPDYRSAVFLISMVLMLAELNVIGLLVNGRFAGAFIDNRNRLSLSKLQAAGWTVVVLGAFATAAAYNIAAAMYGDTSVGALAITIPNELLLAMGISATSLVATPALLTLKSQQEPEQGALTSAKQALDDNNMSNNGKVLVRDDPKDATWADLVTGEEVGNVASPDLGKIQQAFITLLLLGGYIAYCFAQLDGSQDVITGLPTVDRSFVWLLGISHASYLAYKAVPHTVTEDK